MSKQKTGHTSRDKEGNEFQVLLEKAELFNIEQQEAKPVSRFQGRIYRSDEPDKFLLQIPSHRQGQKLFLEVPLEDLREFEPLFEDSSGQITYTVKVSPDSRVKMFFQGTDFPTGFFSDPTGESQGESTPAWNYNLKGKDPNSPDPYSVFDPGSSQEPRSSKYRPSNRDRQFAQNQSFYEPSNRFDNQYFPRSQGQEPFDPGRPAFGNADRYSQSQGTYEQASRPGNQYFNQFQGQERFRPGQPVFGTASQFERQYDERFARQFHPDRLQYDPYNRFEGQPYDYPQGQYPQNRGVFDPTGQFGGQYFTPPQGPGQYFQSQTPYDSYNQPGSRQYDRFQGQVQPNYTGYEAGGRFGNPGYMQNRGQFHHGQSQYDPYGQLTGSGQYGQGRPQFTDNYGGYRYR